jgi:hypothetical protein
MTLPARLAQADTPARFPRLRALADGALARIVASYLTADLRSLAAGRIVLALVLLLDLGKRWMELSLWYTNDGLVPNHTLLWRPGFTPVFSLFFLASYRYEAIAGFLACAAAYAMLLVGWRTRFAQVASLICLLSLHGRMLLIDNGGDVVLGLLTVWTTFLPTGRVFSVDAVLARRPATAWRLRAVPATPAVSAASGVSATPSTTADRPGSFASTAADRPGSFASLGVLAVVLQLAFIYFFNAVHKQGTTWREGSAVHYVLHLDRLVTGLGVWLRGMPTGLARALSYGTLAVEWSLPALLLSPFAVRRCRRLAVTLVVTLHTGFGLCLNLGNFVPAMIAYTPNFVHRDDWDALARWWSRRPRAVRLARAAASVVERAATRLTPGRTMRVTGPGPWARVALRRLSAAREFAVALLLLVAGSQLLDENWAAHKVIDHHNSPPIAAAVTYFDLFQGWSLFAPDAPTSDYNIIVDATTVEGRRVDPLSEVATPRHPAPGLSIPTALGPSWLFYGYENHLRDQVTWYQALEEWILRYPQRTGRPQDRIVAFRVQMIEDDSPPLGEENPRNIRSKVLLQYPH